MRMIVLAGQNAGLPDPLAERFAQKHRSLIPLAGQPMIAHVLHTALHHPRITSLAICVEQEAFEPVWDVLTSLPGRGSVALVAARDELADSVRDAASGWDGPLLVTTADHALLSSAAIDAVAEALADADATLTLAPRHAVQAAHRAASCSFLSFRDGEYAACDIYGVAGVHALHAVEVFRGSGRFDAMASRIRRACGSLGLLLLGGRLLTLSGALALASRRMGLKLAAVVLADGSQAIDVDDDRSYAIARDLLEDRMREHRLADVGCGADERRRAG